MIDTTENQNHKEEDKIEKIEEAIASKAEEIKDESMKGFVNMQETIKEKSKNIDHNLKPVLEEIDQMKEEFHKTIKTPIGIRVMTAIITGLVVGILIWIVMGIISQNFNPGFITWIIGIILIEIADALTNFTRHIQKIATKLLKDTTS